MSGLLRPGRLRAWLGWAALAAAVLFLLLVGRALSWRPFALEGRLPADGFTRVAGVVHVHTTLSDGGGTPDEVVAAASRSGLAFVVITDHNQLAGKPLEGYREGVLVLVGAEISTNAGHLLALGISDPVLRFSGDIQDALDDVRELGGSSYAAHPTSPAPSFRFAGWDLPGPWGLELFNGDSQWRAAGLGRLAFTALLYRFNPAYALLASLTPPRRALERWDALLAQRATPAIVGADAHSRVALHKRVSLRFPSYESLFGLARNHVLLRVPLSGEAGPDGAALLQALASGRSYVGLDALAPAGGFFFAVQGNAGSWTLGDTLPAGPGLVARAGGRLPSQARLLLLRDGRPFAQGRGSLAAEISERGVYRVEVRLPRWDVPWIISNPIYVFDPGTSEQRERRAAWPAAERPPEPALVIESFDGPPAFHAEFDASSRIDPELVEPGGGEDGRAAGQIRFALGKPGAAGDHVWCALVNREQRDLSGRRGLVFSIKGDGIYRIWVQVRDANPASADEGTEWWFASVRTSLEWRRVAVPFERLRSINPASDGRLDLDRVRGLVLVVDEAAVKAGSQGTIWLDEIGVY